MSKVRCEKLKDAYVKIRLDHFLVPVQCTGNSGCCPLGKLAAIVQRYSTVFVFPCVQCFRQCFHTTGGEAYSFTTDGYGIFKMRTYLGACRAHEGVGVGVSRGGGHTSLHKS